MDIIIIFYYGDQDINTSVKLLLIFPNHQDQDMNLVKIT